MSSLVLLPLRNLHFLKVNFSMNVTPKGQNVHQLLSFTSSLNVSKIKVRTGPGKSGKSWNFIMAFSRTGKSWKKATGPGKFWKSVKLS